MVHRLKLPLPGNIPDNRNNEYRDYNHVLEVLILYVDASLPLWGLQGSTLYKYRIMCI